MNLDVDVSSPQAVSVQRETAGSNTVATLALSPLNETWIGWKPRSRDVKREKPVYYAEVYQLYVPSAGVIEGAHYAAIRPAQGELNELVFNVPAGASITDVIDPSAAAAPNDSAKCAAASLVALWRFDPDARKLRVNLSRPQSHSFALVIRSQVATGTLPFKQAVGLVSVDGAAREIGFLGVATGNEVQLDTVDAEGFSPINLEDFPAGVAQSFARPDSRTDCSARVSLCGCERHGVASGLGGGTGRARGNAGHAFAGRRPHRAGGERECHHHARGNFQLELCAAGGNG